MALIDDIIGAVDASDPTAVAAANTAIGKINTALTAIAGAGDLAAAQTAATTLSAAQLPTFATPTHSKPVTPAHGPSPSTRL